MELSWYWHPEVNILIVLISKTITTSGS